MSDKVVRVDAETARPLSFEEAEQERDMFPEGGWQGWLTIAGAALVQFSTFGYTNAFGVYQGKLLCPAQDPFFFYKIRTDFYVRDYLKNYTPSAIGWIGGIQIFLVFSSGIFTGRAFDRGYFHHLMIGGSILYVLSFFMLSLAHEGRYYQIFLSQGLGGGLSTGMLYIPSIAIGSHYFKRQRPLAIGLVTAGTALGAVLHPIMLNRLLHGSSSFAHTVRMSSALNSSLLLVANLMMRTRLPPKKAMNSTSIIPFFKDIPYVLLLIGGMLIICGFSFPVFFLQLYAVANGIGQEFSLYCLPIMNAASIIGRIFPPMLVPRFGVVNLGIFFLTSMAILIFCLPAITNGGAMIAFSILYGFFSGGEVAFTPAMLVHFNPASCAKDVDEIGARIGVSFGLSGVIGLFAIPIAGALLTSDLHWWRPIIFAGSIMIGGSLCYLIARTLLVRQRKTRVV